MDICLSFKHGEDIYGSAGEDVVEDLGVFGDVVTSDFFGVVCVSQGIERR